MLFSDGQLAEYLLEPVGGFARFSPDGSTLLTGNNRGYRLWRSDDWRVQGQLDQQIGSDFPGLGVYAPDGDTVFVILGHQRVALAALPDLRMQVAFEASGNPNLYAMDLDVDGNRLLVGTDDQRVLIWHLDVLRRELTALGIPDWDQTTPTRWPPEVPLWTTAAFLLVVTLALHTLWRQRVLVRDHLRTETLVAHRNQQLLRAREELLHGHKMQALGQLTAGVAHDLRNLLSVISLSNGLLRRGVEGNIDLSEEAGSVDAAVDRGRTLVLSLLGYSSRTTADSGTTDVSHVIKELLRMLGRRFLSGIKVELKMSDTLAPVAMPASQLEQILLNLFVNASEAMGHEGSLTVNVDEGGLPSGPDWVVARLGKARHGVLVSVSDTGPGIPDEVRHRIFEPFFTTKSRGSSVGTGLGLSMVYAIAERHGAGLAVRSAPGATEFVVCLPKAN